MRSDDGKCWLDEAGSLDVDDLPEHDEQEPDYCARCRYAGRCAGFCSVPPELF